MEPRIVASHLSAADLQAVSEWIRLNEAARVAYWDWQIETAETGRFARHTSADQVEAVGDRWSYTYWNPGTNEYAGRLDRLVPRNVDRPIGLSDSVSEPET